MYRLITCIFLLFFSGYCTVSCDDVVDALGEAEYLYQAEESEEAAQLLEKLAQMIREGRTDRDRLAVIQMVDDYYIYIRDGEYHHALDLMVCKYDMSCDLMFLNKIYQKAKNAGLELLDIRVLEFRIDKPRVAIVPVVVTTTRGDIEEGFLQLVKSRSGEWLILGYPEDTQENAMALLPMIPKRNSHPAKTP